jgi:sarcosine oxidase subunit gamma
VTAEAGRRSPLAGYADRFAALSQRSNGALAIREVPFLTQINLRADPADTETMGALERALGLSPPIKPNTVSSQAGRAILWLGPDEWLIVAPSGHEPYVQDAVRTTLGERVGIVDVSANRTVIDLQGAAARDLLAHGCAIDLHPRFFGPGQCAQTLLARAQVIIQPTDGRPGFYIYVRASYAPYLADWLIDARDAV